MVVHAVWHNSINSIPHWKHCSPAPPFQSSLSNLKPPVLYFNQYTPDGLGAWLPEGEQCAAADPRGHVAVRQRVGCLEAG